MGRIEMLNQHKSHSRVRGHVLQQVESGISEDEIRNRFSQQGFLVYSVKSRRGVLPVSKRSQDLVRDILPVTKVGDATIRAKSGLLGAEQGKPSLGWLVGWAEKGPEQTVFAMNMDCKEPSHIAARMTVTQQCLTDIGAI